MSYRSLIEFNHDFCGDLDDEGFRIALRRYLKSACRETAGALQRYGVHVVGMRHHSGTFVIDGTPDGFPVLHLTKGAGQ